LTRLARAAKAYADLGLAIFPTAPRSKIPLAGSRAYLDSRPDASPWSGRPDCNIGLSCIHNRLVLVDEDVSGTLADLGVDLPPTWTSYGRRGPGRWYRVPEGREPTHKDIKGALDIKWRGFGLAPPSIHPVSGRAYRWDLEQKPGVTEPATAPAWLLGPVTAIPPATSVGSAADTFLGMAFRSLGWLGRDLGNGRHAVRCPWSKEHTAEGSDSGTIIFAPSAGGLRVGTFHCSHSHCSHRRSGDVIAMLPKSALVSAATSGYRRELIMLDRRGRNT